MSAIERYPSIPHLIRRRGTTRDDKVLSPEERQRTLASSCLVEEKLDGANVRLWRSEDGGFAVATRGGEGAIDRGRQLGPLRAWVARNQGRLQRLLADAEGCWAEWLWKTHTIAYDALPDYFVVLDLWRPNPGRLPIRDRDAACAWAGLPTPPLLFQGVPESVETLDRLIGPSRFGQEEAEGLVLRRIEGAPIAKLLSHGFSRRSDEFWADETDRRNRVLAR